MSEKPQLDSDISEKPGASLKPPSGFAGKKDQGAAGQSESDRALSQSVSRETSEESELAPEQKMLNDIMDRAMAKSQAELKEKKAETAPQEETPIPEEKEAPPSPPEKNKPSSAYVYLAVLFGAAFLMLLLAYFVQQRNNDAVLDDLRSTTASREELLEDIKALEAERDQLQKEVEYQKGRVKQKNEEAEQLQSTLEDSNSRWSDLHIQTMTLSYFWYIDQFMKNKDYPMAAAAVLFQADTLRETWNTQVAINPVQVEQYESYRQELIDRGYLQELDESPENNGYRIWFTDQWSPSERDDVAALYNLWCALNEHFIFESDNAAAQYLFYYPLGRPETGYQDYVARLTSDFTREQFQIMKDELTEDWFITVLADGSIIKNYSASQTDERYVLPFQLPETESWKYVYYG